MALGWNEIKIRAAEFVNEWRDRAPTAREEADAQTFETGFLGVFGVSRSQTAIFEHRVALRAPSLQQTYGYIDLFWKGHILIEMKSPDKDMTAAFEQAKNYANALPPEDLPAAILICDFTRFHYYDLTQNAALTAFTLDELPEYVTLFSDLAGYREIEFRRQEAVNIRAAETMGRLHDQLKAVGYSGHQLELYLVRLLFCLFADDTEIFEPSLFHNYIVNRTNIDGSDLALHIDKIFSTLNQPQNKRLQTVDEQLYHFPYVNGGLFAERLETADFDSRMRNVLLECCALDWSKISPAIFGAMFQSVMNADERHDLGAHYTSEENILKVISPLFLDALWEEFEKIRQLAFSKRQSALRRFHEKLASLRFFDPACGCGNFLVITYRELRLLELEVITELYGDRETLKFEVEHYVKVDVNQFYGIEIEEFPSQIAQTAMWLTDHQMNLKVRDRFGQYFARIPLIASPTIVCGNALTIDWQTLLNKENVYTVRAKHAVLYVSEPTVTYGKVNVIADTYSIQKQEDIQDDYDSAVLIKFNYIFGNPPFLGARIMSNEQKADVERIFNGAKNCGNLDYVTCWYRKAAEYIQDTGIECAFVSTNSICQGEQVPVLWQLLMKRFGIKINFAHQTFKWTNEARGKAAVHCVVVGFSRFDRKEKRLYTYKDIRGKAEKVVVKQINPYLIDAETVFIESRKTPLCDVPEMIFGSMPNDGGNFLLSEDEKNALVSQNPAVAPFIRPFVGAREFINNIPRYCIWLKNIVPDKYANIKEVRERIAAVCKHRENSARDATRRLADFPTLFGEVRQPDSDYLIIPSVSSERRKYIPIGFLSNIIIASDANLLIPNATLYDFGIMTSTMHNAWMRYVCGRLELRYRYSVTIVYNNFPFPSPTDKQREAIEQAAQKVLDVRNSFSDSSLAVLYDPDTMPPALLKAHQALDRAVEKGYGRTFKDDAARVAFLFERYRELTKDLFTEKVKKKRK
jgi:hypothetical protein